MGGCIEPGALGMGWDGLSRDLRRSVIQRHLILEVTSFPRFEAVVEVTPVMRTAAFTAIAS